MTSRTCVALDDVEASMPRGGSARSRTRLPESGLSPEGGGERLEWFENRALRHRFRATGGGADTRRSGEQFVHRLDQHVGGNGFARTFAAPISLAM